MGIGVRVPAHGAGELLGIDIFEARHKLKAQQMTESEGHLVLPVSIY
jgi:hypothetical protein